MVTPGKSITKSRKPRTILYPELNLVTKDIMPKPNIYIKLNNFNDKYISVVPSTSQSAVRSLMTKYPIRGGVKPYTSDATGNRYLKLFKNRLGIIPTTKEIPHRVLLPFKGMRDKRDEALLHFEELPTLDKFFLINLVVWGSFARSTNREYTPIDAPTLLSKRLKSSTFDETIIPKEYQDLQNDAPNIPLGVATFKYLLDTNPYPRSATTPDTFYPHIATIFDIEKYSHLGSLADTSYIEFSGFQNIHEYRTHLGYMLAIRAKSSGAPKPKDDDMPNSLERALYLDESSSNYYEGIDDAIFSGTMIHPLFDHALGIGRNSDLSKAYSYITAAEHILKSINSLLPNIYAATLREAKESNGTAPTLLDFFGKHNLFDTRAAAFVHRVKEDMKAKNHITMWYNICKATRYLDTNLRRSGVTNGIGGLYQHTANRDPALFMVDECNTGTAEFLSSVETGETGSLKVMSVPGSLESPGMHNADPYIRSALNLNPDNVDIIRNTAFNFTTEVNPFAVYGSTAYQDEVRRYPTNVSPFKGHVDGIELLSYHLVRLNKEFRSSMLLKSHNSPYLKSLHKIFMSYINAATTSGAVCDINDPDHVLYCLTDTMIVREEPSAVTEYRYYTPVSTTDGDIDSAYMTIPDSIHDITSTLRQPSLKHVEFAFENTLVNAFPNNSAVTGILFQDDILHNYDMVKNSVPGIWPPDAHRDLAYYLDDHSDIYSCNDIHDIFANFSFINTSTCEPGDYDLIPSAYGAMYELNIAYVSRDATYVNIGDKILSPSTPVRYQVRDLNDDFTERTTTIVEDGVPRRVPIYIDRGINTLSAITYTNSAIIPRSLARANATPGARDDDEYICNIRDTLDSCMRQRVSPNYLKNLGVDTKNMDLIFSVSEDLTDSHVHIKGSGLENLVKNIHSIGHGMSALSIILTDYLTWRAENFPDDTRFLATTIKLRDLCLKYSNKEFTSGIITNIISQALNGDSIDILREV